MTVVPVHPFRCAWRGGFGSAHSLAIVNDGVTGALEAAGVQVERRAWNDPALDEQIVGVAGQWPPRFQAPSAGPFVLYQPWEFGCIPQAWTEEIRRRIDEVWTPSENTRQAYIRSGIAPGLVHVMPNGVDTERFTPEGDRWPLQTTKGTVLLFVGGLTHRKGADVLLEAYMRAFTAADDVCLVLKGFGAGSFYRGTMEAHVANFQSMSGAPELLLINDDVPYDRLPSLYRAADVIVQPYRGEGFCLPALEALASGKPLVVTAGGPTDEFASDRCAWRIPAHETPLRPGTLPPDLALAADGFMLEPSLDALVDILREAADPDLRAAKAATAREHAERLTWGRVGRLARARLEAITGEPIRTVPDAVVPGRRGRLFVAGTDWPPALRAYAAAFTHDADTTLAFAGPEEQVVAELQAAGIDPGSLADVALTEHALNPAALELAADAVITGAGPHPLRARCTVPPDPAALRAVAAN